MIENRIHLAYLDGLRAIAALCVVLLHVQMLSCGDPSNPLNGPYIQRFIVSLLSGTTAVGVFIFLSGYCLWLPYASGKEITWLSFMKRRARRILPPFYAATILTSLLIWMHVIGGHPSRETLLAHLFLVHNVAGHPDSLQYGDQGVSPVFWSIAVEWQIYLMVPFLITLARRYGPLAFLSAVSILAYASFLFSWGSRFQGLNILYLALFCTGAISATLCHGTEYSRVKPNTLTLMLAGATGLILFAATPIYRGYREVFIALGMLGLSIKLAEGGLVASVLGSKPLRALGSFSYSLYLVHYSVLQPVWHGWLGRMHLQPTVGFLSLLILGGSAAITVAYLFHLLFERPFIQPPKRLPSIDESSRIATV